MTNDEMTLLKTLIFTIQRLKLDTIMIPRQQYKFRNRGLYAKLISVVCDALVLIQ